MVNTIPAPARVLLPEFDKSVSDDEEGAFFASLHRRNGTTRMTSSGRLTEVSATIVDHLPAVSRLEALDAGISSGISTVEWLLSLEALQRTCFMTAFGRVLYALLFKVGQLQLLSERDGYVLLMHNGRHSLTRPVHRTASLRNRVARTAFLLGDVAAKLAGVVGAGCQVQLVSQHRRSRSDVHLLEHDIYNPAPDWIGCFHVVRVANLLNRSYFPEPILRVGLRNAGNWVQLGGLLMVARTETDGHNHATLFRRETTGLRAIHRLDSGSELETLVTSVVPSQIRARP